MNYTVTSQIIRNQIRQQSELGKAIIPFLTERYILQTVADFGCGVGELLRMFVDKIRISDYVGIDYYDYSKNLKIPKENFIRIDFEKSVCLFRKFDLVISLEVAEHLPEKTNFAEKLIMHANNLILFSAATLGQGGDHHINEQDESYWEEKFNKQGFEKFDIIRPLIKNNKNIAWWYRQNILIYEKINDNL